MVGHRHELGGAIERVEDAERGHAEQRGAQARSLRRGGVPDRAAEGGREDLAPQLAAREAPRCADLADLQPGLAERAEHDRELEAHPLDGRAQQVLAPVLAREAQVDAAGVARPVRRALSQQVGQEEEPPAARRRSAGDLEQRRGAGAAGGDRLGRHVGRDRVGQPVEHDAAVVDRAADHVAVGREHVAEHPAALVHTRRVGDDAHGAAGADRARHGARPDRAQAEVGQRAVAASGHDRRPRGEPHEPCPLVVERQRGGGGNELRQLFARHARVGQGLGIPVLVAEVEQAGRRGHAVVDHQLARHPLHDVVLDPDPVPDARRRRRAPRRRTSAASGAATSDARACRSAGAGRDPVHRSAAAPPDRRRDCPPTSPGASRERRRDRAP